MALGLIDDSILTNIAIAIREKTSTDQTYLPSEMANAISELKTDFLEAPSLSNFYYWEKYGSNGMALKETDYTNVTISYYNPTSLEPSNYVWDTVNYADSYTITNNKIVLTNPTSFVLNNEVDNSVILGKYIQTGFNDNFYFIPEDATITYEPPQGEYLFGHYIRASKATRLTYEEVEELVNIVISTDNSAYPEDGEQNGFRYVYIGSLE